MYGIFAYMSPKFMVNVAKYSIHGAFGFTFHQPGFPENTKMFMAFPAFIKLFLLKFVMSPEETPRNIRLQCSVRVSKY